MALWAEGPHGELSAERPLQDCTSSQRHSSPPAAGRRGPGESPPVSSPPTSSPPALPLAAKPHLKVENSEQAGDQRLYPVRQDDVKL